MDGLSMDLPIIDLDIYLNNDPSSPSVQAECLRAAEALITYGALILHNSQVSDSDNDSFLDLLEDYFDQPEASLRRDERPDLSYQVGVTLDNTEKPKCAVDEPCLDIIQRLHPSQRPLDISGHQPDPKCRFFWRTVEQPPYKTQFPGLNASNIIPDAPHIKHRWTPIMDQWGTSMKNAVSKLSEMTAIGLGLPAQYFSDAGRYGFAQPISFVPESHLLHLVPGFDTLRSPHLLAPTASDLRKYGDRDTILAGFHTDLNFLTIHGRSRYPGLNIWARNTGSRIPVRIPAGSYLLVQAGKQIEYITGGLIKAGYHEVVVNERTIETMERRGRESPDRPLIRISSTLFWHLNSDFDLAPLPHLAERAAALRAEQARLGRDEGAEVLYPPVKVGHQVEGELKHIALMV